LIAVFNAGWAKKNREFLDMCIKDCRPVQCSGFTLEQSKFDLSCVPLLYRVIIAL